MDEEIMNTNGKRIMGVEVAGGEGRWQDATSLKANEIKTRIHNKSTNYATQLYTATKARQWLRQKGSLCISQILRYFQAAPAIFMRKNNKRNA